MNISDPSPPSDDQSQHPDRSDTASALPAGEATRRVWRSDELFGADNEVLILHDDKVYRLRRTRNGKLILHK